jgi:glucosamine kinase
MTNPQHWLLGVDGGGTSCRVRLCDTTGKLLGQGQAGSANVRLGAQTVFNSISQATAQALAIANLDASILSRTYAGLGLAGAVSEQLNQSIIDYPHPFADLCVDNDAVTACLGAHNGESGGVLILGTGSCAMINNRGKFTVLGGWGLTISDHGSGAKLGQDFTREALAAFEGLIASSPLSKAFMALHDNSPPNLLYWADNAQPRDFGALVPMIIDYYHAGDPMAMTLIDMCLSQVQLLLERSCSLGASKISLMGGFANFIETLIDHRLPAKFQHIIVPAQGDALDGAIIIATQLANKK